MDQLNLPADRDVAVKIIDHNAKHEAQRISLGVVGRFFGESPSLPVYIVAALCTLMVLSGLVYTFIPDSWKSTSTVELWKVFVPIITSFVGFIFGSAKKNAR